MCAHVQMRARASGHMRFWHAPAPRAPRCAEASRRAMQWHARRPRSAWPHEQPHEHDQRSHGSPLPAARPLLRVRRPLTPSPLAASQPPHAARRPWPPWRRAAPRQRRRAVTARQRLRQRVHGRVQRDAPHWPCVPHAMQSPRHAVQRQQRRLPPRGACGVLQSASERGRAGTRVRTRTSASERVCTCNMRRACPCAHLLHCKPVFRHELPAYFAQLLVEPRPLGPKALALRAHSGALGRCIHAGFLICRNARCLTCEQVAQPRHEPVLRGLKLEAPLPHSEQRHAATTAWGAR